MFMVHADFGAKYTADIETNELNGWKCADPKEWYASNPGKELYQEDAPKRRGRPPKAEEVETETRFGVGGKSNIEFETETKE